MNLKQTVRTKIMDLYRGINEFKNVYHPKTNLVEDENNDLNCRFPQYFEQMEAFLWSAIEFTCHY
jgi:hypothetical protein